MKVLKTYQLLFFGLLFLQSCEINQYNLDKKDIVNFSLQYGDDMMDLKLGLRSHILQHGVDSSYYVPVVTVGDRLSLAHINKIGEYISTIDVTAATSLVDFKEIGNFYFALSQDQGHIKVSKISKDFTLVNEWEMGSYVAGSNITSTRGGHLYYDFLTNNIYIGGICTDSLLGDQMIMMSLDQDLFPVWPDIKKYFDNAIASSTVPSDLGYLIVTGVKSDDAPFYVKMNRFGNLLDNIFLIDELDKDSINDAHFIGNDLYITGSTILPNRQAVVARVDTLDQSIISIFGIGCDAINSRCNNFKFDSLDGSILALADNFDSHEVHLTKFNYQTLSLDWNQCYPNLFQANSTQSLAMIKSLDDGFVIASLESRIAGQYYLRLTKTDRLGEVRF